MMQGKAGRNCGRTQPVERVVGGEEENERVIEDPQPELFRPPTQTRYPPHRWREFLAIACIESGGEHMAHMRRKLWKMYKFWKGGFGVH